MKNRKYNLLPYETIVKATAGEPDINAKIRVSQQRGKRS